MMGRFFWLKVNHGAIFPRTGSLAAESWDLSRCEIRKGGEIVAGEIPLFFLRLS